MYIRTKHYNTFTGREMTTTYGLWDQVRIDKGKEWYLTLSVVAALSDYRHNTTKPSYLQTSSTKVCRCNSIASSLTFSLKTTNPLTRLLVYVVAKYNQFPHLCPAKPKVSKPQLIQSFCTVNHSVV